MSILSFYGSIFGSMLLYINFVTIIKKIINKEQYSGTLAIGMLVNSVLLLFIVFFNMTIIHKMLSF